MFGLQSCKGDALRGKRITPVGKALHRHHAIRFQLPGARQILPQRRGAGLDDGEDGREHRSDMDKVGNRAGLHHRNDRRTAGQRLQRRDQPDRRTLPRREPRPLFCQQPANNDDPCFGGADIGLRTLNPRGDRRLSGDGPFRLVALGRCLAVKRGRPHARRKRLCLGVTQLRPRVTNRIWRGRSDNRAGMEKRRRAQHAQGHSPDHRHHPSR